MPDLENIEEYLKYKTRSGPETPQSWMDTAERAWKYTSGQIEGTSIHSVRSALERLPEIMYNPATFDKLPMLAMELAGLALGGSVGVGGMGAGPRLPKGFKLFDLQNKTAERIVHQDWNKGNSYRYLLEGAGDIFREFTKTQPASSYIGEKANRIAKMLEARKRGTLHRDDSISAAPKEGLDQLRKAYEAIPHETKEQKNALDLVISMTKGEFAESERLLAEIMTSIKDWD